ncbi:MAG: nucleoside phosphorylase [Microbacteriaceae bacterium]|nr:nucleoside phosphorylase [Microbacteriaceae bacterium]MCL2794358.1 nucleoside phosphorylase [Microbacteriaceae bacterium]
MIFALGEFDSEDDGPLRPMPLDVDGVFPAAAVLCFFPEAIDDLHRDGTLSRVGQFSAQLGGAGIYATEDRRVVVFHPGVGGPLSAHNFERAIASGVTRAVAVGGAGAIDAAFGKDDVLVVASAVRDEGTSFHYLPANRTVELDDEEARRIVRGFTVLGIPARLGRTWTTDADFRETRARVERRKAEGCIAVEMEAASLAAVALFRNIRYAHVLYSGDELHGPTWAERSWTTSSRRPQLLRAAIALAAH